MNKTTIEWVKNPDGSQGYTLNSKTGCRNHTPEGLCLGGLFPCYAFKLANGRLKPLYLANTNLAPDAKGGVSKLSIGGQVAIEREGDYADPFHPRFWDDRLYEPYNIRKPIGIFLDDMGDWMLDCWPREYTEVELRMMRDNPRHRIYTLTKQPQNLIKFSPFPDNAWVGVTATNWLMFSDGLGHLASIEAKVKYLSFEPLLERIQMDMMQKMLFPKVIDWLIIGACTGTLAEMVNLGLRNGIPDKAVKAFGNKYTLQPRIEWVREIVEAADKAEIPVFLKDDLKPMIPVGDSLLGDEDHDYKWQLRQELPNKIVANCPKCLF